MRQRKPLTLKIPAGVSTGTRIRLSGEGEAGTGGGPNGDLYVELRVNPDETFTREGDDLHATMTVPMTAAALGTTINLETFDGTQEVTVKPGTQTGQTTTLRDLGVTKLRGTGRGNIVVHFEVETPSKINDEQRELLRKLAELRGEDDVVGETMQNTGHGFFSRLRDRFQD